MCQPRTYSASELAITPNDAYVMQDDIGLQLGAAMWRIWWELLAKGVSSS